MYLRTITVNILATLSVIVGSPGCDEDSQHQCADDPVLQDGGCFFDDPEHSESDTETNFHEETDSEVDSASETNADTNTDTGPAGIGTPDDPIVIPCSSLPCEYEDTRDTHDAPSDRYDSYPPNEVNESGPEFIYVFTVSEEVRLSVGIDSPEPTGVDVDVHLLSNLDPLTLIARDHHRIFAVLPPGTYYLSLDTFVNSAGDDLRGPYHLRVSIRSRNSAEEQYFNQYILDAVEELYTNYGLLGYGDSVLTHDIEYGSYGIIKSTGGSRTMCVAAVMEVMLTAMQIYAKKTGDTSVWDFLPIESWEGLGAEDIKAHIWVNFELESAGTGDALGHFGMGETVTFEDLLPGSFVNFNRLEGSGHAVVFLSYIDADGIEYAHYHDSIIGFRYFSSQGGYDIGSGGLDYRYAIFATDEYESGGYPTMPYKRDIHILRSDNQRYLNTGMMWHPEHWNPTVRPTSFQMTEQAEQMSFFDPIYFDGVTVDDNIE